MLLILILSCFTGELSGVILNEYTDLTSLIRGYGSVNTGVPSSTPPPPPEQPSSSRNNNPAPHSNIPVSKAESALAKKIAKGKLIAANFTVTSSQAEAHMRFKHERNREELVRYVLIDVHYPALIFSNPRDRQNLNWVPCNEGSLKGKFVKGVTGSSRGNGRSGQSCFSNLDCDSGLNAKLSCYRPFCTCQKAKPRVMAKLRRNSLGAIEIIPNALLVDNVLDFEDSDMTFPEDVEYEKGPDGKIFVKVPCK